MRLASRFAGAVLLLLAACGGSDDGGAGGGDDSGGDDQQTPIDAPAETTADVSGSIARTATPDTGADAKGPIYIAIFDKDPIIDRATAQVVARTVITNADLSASGATITYTLEDVPTRMEKYFFVAFLDDNQNVDPNNAAAAGPDKGDLVSLDGLASPKLTLALPAATTYNATLNTMLPF